MFWLRLESKFSNHERIEHEKASLLWFVTDTSMLLGYLCALQSCYRVASPKHGCLNPKNSVVHPLQPRLARPLTRGHLLPEDNFIYGQKNEKTTGVPDGKWRCYPFFACRRQIFRLIWSSRIHEHLRSPQAFWIIEHEPPYDLIGSGYQRKTVA